MAILQFPAPPSRPVIRSIRDEFVEVARPPASSLVRVAGLFRPDVLIAIEAVAGVPA
jgi:enamine deaminase RidA (YjgF/YER057c/UK114 family)